MKEAMELEMLKILIADSYSFEHSVKEWDYDVLYSQLKTGYWIFEKTN